MHHLSKRLRMKPTLIDIAVIGAGPVGLALALHAARALPHAHDHPVRQPRRRPGRVGRPAHAGAVAGQRAVAAAPGCLAATSAAQPILEVHVSQQPPSLPCDRAAGPSRRCASAPPKKACRCSARCCATARWWRRCSRPGCRPCSAEPQRLHSRFGTPVAALKPLRRRRGGRRRHRRALRPGRGGRRRRVRRAGAQGAGPRLRPDRLGGHGHAATAARPGVAFERFTRHGPAALLPLRRAADGQASARRAGVVRGRATTTRCASSTTRSAWPC